MPILSSAGSIWKSYNPPNDYKSFTFSPDGKWVVFRDHPENFKNPLFIAVPINESNPLYLGKPIKLGNAMREDAIGPTGTAWSTNPTALVMCDGAILYQWDLGDFDKMPKQKMPSNSAEPLKKIAELQVRYVCVFSIGNKFCRMFFVALTACLIDLASGFATRHRPHRLFHGTHIATTTTHKCS